jgi:hypothetical protein
MIALLDAEDDASDGHEESAVSSGEGEDEQLLLDGESSDDDASWGSDGQSVSTAPRSPAAPQMLEERASGIGATAAGVQTSCQTCDSRTRGARRARSACLP